MSSSSSTAAAPPKAHSAPPRTVARAVKACHKTPIEIVSTKLTDTLALATCNGDALPAAVERMSILANAPSTHFVDRRLVERLELAVDHFRKSGEHARVQIVSGYRLKSARSFHANGRALDFRIEGVDNTALVTFCKTLPDTGCGYYPNSTFVHMDVRDPGTGRISWIDASRPGEPPKYVTSWPPKDDKEDKASLALPALPDPDSHDAPVK